MQFWIFKNYDFQNFKLSKYEQKSQGDSNLWSVVHKPDT